MNILVGQTVQPPAKFLLSFWGFKTEESENLCKTSNGDLLPNLFPVLSNLAAMIPQVINMISQVLCFLFKLDGVVIEPH